MHQDIGKLATNFETEPICTIAGQVAWGEEGVLQCTMLQKVEMSVLELLQRIVSVFNYNFTSRHKKK